MSESSKRDSQSISRDHLTETAVDIPLSGTGAGTDCSGSKTSKSRHEDDLIARAWDAVQGDSKPRDGSAVSSTLAAPSDPWDSTPTDSIPGYEILHEIHRGGQGVVYQAIQKAAKRKVAIKVMKEGPFAGARDKARFEREVQILGQLNHPHIVTIHDSGMAAGSFYYVMDYISGLSLDAYIADQAERSRQQKEKRPKSDTGSRLLGRLTGSRSSSRSRKDRRESFDNILRLFMEICEAVNAAHLRGVIHRDLKPGNIRVDSEGHPHILDFGLAKVATGNIIGGDEPMLMTMTGQFVGSLPWASPEQAEGIPSKIDIRTDVYSLGVILYQMLTGRFPYEVVGNMRDVLDNILMAEPARPSTIRRQINDEIETIVLKCLSKDRERRYQSAGAVAEDLKRYLTGEAIEAKRDSLLYFLRKKATQHAYVSVGFGAILIAFGSWVFSTVRSERNERQHAATERIRAEQFLRQVKSLEDLASTSQDQVRRFSFGWFLYEWNNNRIDRASEIRSHVPADLPEYAAMSFLLNPAEDDTTFLAKLPKSNIGFGHLVVAERHVKNQNWKDAVQAYKQCLATTDDHWLRATAMAGLKQIESPTTPQQ